MPNKGASSEKASLDNWPKDSRKIIALLQAEGLADKLSSTSLRETLIDMTKAYPEKSNEEIQSLSEEKVEKHIKISRQERPDEIIFIPSEPPEEGESAKNKQSRQKEDREQYEFEKKLQKEKIKVIDDYSKAKGNFVINLNNELQRKEYIVSGDVVGKMYDDVWNDFNSTKDERSTVINEKLHSFRFY